MYIETSPNKVGKYHLIEWLKQWARAQCYGLLFDYFLKDVKLQYINKSSKGKSLHIFKIVDEVIETDEFYESL